MFSTSAAEESGSIGTTTLPNGTTEKYATVQLGMFCDRMATLSPALMPKRDILCERSRHMRRNSA